MRSTEVPGMLDLGELHEPGNVQRHLDPCEEENPTPTAGGSPSVTA